MELSQTWSAIYIPRVSPVSIDKMPYLSYDHGHILGYVDLYLGTNLDLDLNLELGLVLSSTKKLLYKPGPKDKRCGF